MKEEKVNISFLKMQISPLCIMSRRYRTSSFVLPSPTTICWKTSSFISIYFSSDYLFKTNEPKYFCGEEKGEERQEDDAPFFKLSTEQLCEHSKDDAQDKKVNKTITVIRVARRAWICFLKSQN